MATTTHRLTRILATKTDDGIELGVETESGEILKLLATDEQIDALFEELDDLVSADDTEDAAT